MGAKTLERILSPVRLGWHAFALSAGAAGLLMLDQNVARYAGMAILGFGSAAYVQSLRSFLRTRAHILKHGELDARFVRDQLLFYCNRQGARSAAANAGLAADFDRIMGTYEGEMALRYLPHL